METQDWRQVDEGWGRHAVDFATLSEPGNCREYAALQHALGIDAGDRVLDLACGAGLALELAGIRGARCAGIDASPRLVDVARDRMPGGDLRVGDMQALPWPDSCFDVVTSFRGIWATTPGAVEEAHRVLTPGGRLGLTVWGHIKRSPGAWALAPFALATPTKVTHQAAMVALGRPGAGEDLLRRSGFGEIRRLSIPFVWEFADPEAYARALLSTGPAYEAVQAVGEEAFVQYAVDLAQARLRDGLPLRAPIALVGFTARKPADAGDQTGAGAGFLGAADPSPQAQALYDEDRAQAGFVMNASRLWAHQPAINRDLFALLDRTARAAALTYRQRGILIASSAASRGDAYCALAWGSRLAAEAGVERAAAVLRADDDALDPAERALAAWARLVVDDPNAAVAADLQPLRDAGYDDPVILAITAFVALRMAFSSVNDALGSRPDHELADQAPEAVRTAVSFGRPVAAGPPLPGGPA